MVVSRRSHKVVSFDDIGLLFSPLPSQPFTSKATKMTTPSTSPASASSVSDDQQANALLAQALEQLRNARQELGQQVADATASAKASIEKTEDLTQKFTKLETATGATVETLTARIHDLEKAAAAAAGQPEAKKPVYKRALDVVQQIGGVAAFAGGIGLGAKLAYDRFTGNGDSAEA